MVCVELTLLMNTTNKPLILKVQQRLFSQLIKRRLLVDMLFVVVPQLSTRMLLVLQDGDGIGLFAVLLILVGFI